MWKLFALLIFLTYPALVSPAPHCDETIGALLTSREFPGKVYQVTRHSPETLELIKNMLIAAPRVIITRFTVMYDDHILTVDVSSADIENFLKYISKAENGVISVIGDKISELSQTKREDDFLRVLFQQKKLTSLDAHQFYKIERGMLSKLSMVVTLKPRSTLKDLLTELNVKGVPLSVLRIPPEDITYFNGRTFHATVDRRNLYLAAHAFTVHAIDSAKILAKD